MMYAFYNDNGEIYSTKILFDGDIQFYAGNYVQIDDGQVSAETHYVTTNGELIQKPAKPNSFAMFNYDTKSWTTELSEEIKNTIIQRLKNEASSLILSAYPLHKQMNMQATYSELLTNNGLMEDAAISIKAAWDWIKQVRSASNAAENLLESAATIDAAEMILISAYNSVGAAPIITNLSG